MSQKNDMYYAIADAFVKQGYSPEEAFKKLKKSNFRVKFDNKIQSVYASRVMAIMHEMQGGEGILSF